MPIPPIFPAINRVHSHFILRPAQVTHCAYGTCGFWAGTYIVLAKKLCLGAQGKVFSRFG